MNEVVPISEARAYVSLIERAALDPAFDMTKFERMIKLKDAAQEAQARREFNVAMGYAQAELPQVVRDAENSQTKSEYATLAAIGEAIDPIITKHGFFLSFGSEESPVAGCYRIVCTTGHSGGHERVDKLDLPSDAAGIAGTKNKTPIHALKSTLTYGRTILTMMVFNVKSRKAGADDDGNGAAETTPEAISPEQIKTLEALIVKSKSDRLKFLKWLKVASLDVLTTDRFDKAEKALNDKLEPEARKDAK